eukprot:6269568-Pyramimonas_sp.AAC.3
MRDKNKKRETKKFVAFVETAYRIDPRIITMKQREKVRGVTRGQQIAGGVARGAHRIELCCSRGATRAH